MFLINFKINPVEILLSKLEKHLDNSSFLMHWIVKYISALQVPTVPFSKKKKKVPTVQLLGVNFYR